MTTVQIIVAVIASGILLAAFGWYESLASTHNRRWQKALTHPKITLKQPA